MALPVREYFYTAEMFASTETAMINQMHLQLNVVNFLSKKENQFVCGRLSLRYAENMPSYLKFTISNAWGQTYNVKTVKFPPNKENKLIYPKEGSISDLRETCPVYL